MTNPFVFGALFSKSLTEEDDYVRPDQCSEEVIEKGSKEEAGNKVKNGFNWFAKPTEGIFWKKTTQPSYGFKFGNNTFARECFVEEKQLSASVLSKQTQKIGFTFGNNTYPRPMTIEECFEKE